MDYSNTLSWLQNLLGNNQSMYGQQWGQGLAANQGALSDVLGNQRTLQTQSLTEAGRQHDADLALQKVIADWQNQMANKQYGLQAGAQRYSQDMGTKSYYDSLTDRRLAASEQNPLVLALRQNQIDRLRPGATFTPASKSIYSGYSW